MSHKFLCSIGYLVHTIGRDVMKIACFAASQNPGGSVFETLDVAALGLVEGVEVKLKLFCRFIF